MPKQDRPSIREDDIESRTIERRTFLGRFAVATGLAGLVGWTAACGSESDPADTDSGDPVDNDPTDTADFDSGDPSDSD
jgi:hypothetical protein